MVALERTTIASLFTLSLFVFPSRPLAAPGDAGLYDPARPPFHVIAASGRPSAQIVTPPSPTELEAFAAGELSRYMERISGARLPIVKEGERTRLPYSFFVGNTQAAARPGVKATDETMGRDGLALNSIAGGVIVLGRNDLGTVFAVYELLERCFDVRWFMPGETGEYVPHRNTLRMGEIHLTLRPSFRIRWVGTGEWALRQRMNVYVTAGGKDVGVRWKWGFHTFNTLIPPEKYYADHPEYFALVEGKRSVTDSRTHGNQLCTSNPDLIRELSKNLKAVLDAEPDIEIVALSPNDGGGFCECARCRALDEPGRDRFARYSRRLAIFNNEVARAVKESHPNVLVKVGAYAGYARPPLDPGYRPEENIAVQLCHLYFCHNHPVGAGKCTSGVTYEPTERFLPNEEFEHLLDQWLRLSPRLFIYEYYDIAGMSRAKLPWPLVHSMRSDIPYYCKRGVEGFYTQLHEDSWYRLGLNYYIAAKLAWNADLNVDALLDDYFKKFYGPAARPMKGFFLGMEQAMESWNGCASYGLQGVEGLKTIAPKAFTPAVVKMMGTRLAAAETAAARDDVVRGRVAMARQMYVELEASLRTLKRN
jgi:hypothetical protein